MVSKKSFTLLVDTGTIPFFAVGPIISDGSDCMCVCFIWEEHFSVFLSVRGGGGIQFSKGGTNLG